MFGRASAEPLSETVRIGYVSFPPFTYTDESGRAAGTLTELTRRVLEAAGIPYEFIPLPARRIARYIQSGDIHIFQGVTTLPEFTGKVLVSETRLNTIRLFLYHPPDVERISHYTGLKGKRVVTLLGYSYGRIGEFLSDPASGAEVLAVNERESAVRVLEMGRMDYLLDYRNPAAQALGEDRLADLIYYPLLELPTYWIVSKAYPHARELVQTLDRTYQRLLKNGSIPQ